MRPISIDGTNEVQNNAQNTMPRKENDTKTIRTIAHKDSSSPKKHEKGIPIRDLPMSFVNTESLSTITTAFLLNKVADAESANTKEKQTVVAIGCMLIIVIKLERFAEYSAETAIWALENLRTIQRGYGEQLNICR